MFCPMTGTHREGTGTEMTYIIIILLLFICELNVIVVYVNLFECDCLFVIICYFVLQDGWSALIWAANNGHDTIVSFLISHGANVNAKDNVSKNKLNLINNNI